MPVRQMSRASDAKGPCMASLVRCCCHDHSMCCCHHLPLLLDYHACCCSVTIWAHASTARAPAGPHSFAVAALPHSSKLSGHLKIIEPLARNEFSGRQPTIVSVDVADTIGTAYDPAAPISAEAYASLVAAALPTIHTYFLTFTKKISLPHASPNLQYI